MNEFNGRGVQANRLNRNGLRKIGARMALGQTSDDDKSRNNTVLNPITNHLRLHIEDGGSSGELGLDLPAWDHLQSAYQGLTGWQLDCRPGAAATAGRIDQLDPRPVWGPRRSDLPAADGQCPHTGVERPACVRSGPGDCGRPGRIAGDADRAAGTRGGAWRRPCR